MQDNNKINYVNPFVIKRNNESETAKEVRIFISKKLEELSNNDIKQLSYRFNEEITYRLNYLTAKELTFKDIASHPLCQVEESVLIDVCHDLMKTGLVKDELDFLSLMHKRLYGTSFNNYTSKKITTKYLTDEQYLLAGLEKRKQSSEKRAKFNKTIS